MPDDDAGENGRRYSTPRWWPSFPNRRTIVDVHTRMNGGDPCECPWCVGATNKGTAEGGIGGWD